MDKSSKAITPLLAKLVNTKQTANITANITKGDMPLKIGFKIPAKNGLTPVASLVKAEEIAITQASKNAKSQAIFCPAIKRKSTMDLPSLRIRHKTTKNNMDKPATPALLNNSVIFHVFGKTLGANKTKIIIGIYHSKNFWIVHFGQWFLIKHLSIDIS